MLNIDGFIATQRYQGRKALEGGKAWGTFEHECVAEKDMCWHVMLFGIGVLIVTSPSMVLGMANVLTC